MSRWDVHCWIAWKIIEKVQELICHEAVEDELSQNAESK